MTTAFDIGDRVLVHRPSAPHEVQHGRIVKTLMCGKNTVGFYAVKLDGVNTHWIAALSELEPEKTQ
jgi:hypothetical protein